jgi:hypothetical protein
MLARGIANFLQQLRRPVIVCHVQRLPPLARCESSPDFRFGKTDDLDHLSRG